MLALGLILVAIAAGALVAVLASGTDDQANLFGSTLEMPTLVVFLAGAATLLVFIVGLELARTGVRRANRTRRDRKRLRDLEKTRGDEAVTGGPDPAKSTGGTAATSGSGTTETATQPRTEGADRGTSPGGPESGRVE